LEYRIGPPSLAEPAAKRLPSPPCPTMRRDTYFPDREHPGEARMGKTIHAIVTGTLSGSGRSLTTDGAIGP